MRRREFIAATAITGMAPQFAWGQQSQLPIFGILLAVSSEAGKTFTRPIRAYMEALGYVEGRNIAFDVRYAAGKVERLPAFAAELVAQRPTVIATFGDAAGLAAKGATSEIPIVAMSEDLVRAKLVKSMARPDANITGLSVLGTELDAKRLEMLAEVLPPRSSVLLLADATTHRGSRPAINAVAKTLGLNLQEAVVSSPDDVEEALRKAGEKGFAGVNVLSSAFLFVIRQRIIDASSKHNLATMFQWPETAEDGGLLAYGPSLLGAFRHVSSLVVKILRGAKPQDLPIEQPTRFAFYINLKTARSLKLHIPETILVRSDKAID